MSGALRVLMLSDVSPLRPGGGAERMLWEQASRLAARGYDVRVLCRSHPDGADGWTERQGVRVRHFPVDGRSRLRFVASSILGARRAASEALGERGADVLHLHQPLAAYGALLSPASRGIPSIYSFYSPAPLEYRSRRGMTVHHRAGWTGDFGVVMLWLLERACLRRARLIHVLSDFSADLLWKLYRVPTDRIVRIPGAVDVERFRPAPDRDSVRRTLELPPARPVLLTVRNLEARMGLDLLLRAMALLKGGAPDALLLIGGTGSRRRELESLSRSLGLDGTVRFLGFVPDEALPRYYQAADLFVLPTRELEGFGLVTVEALACGTPVMGTAVGATPEILVPLSPALVFRGTAPEVMAQDLERFLAARARDPEADVRLRRACRLHVEASYGWSHAISALETALSRLVGRGAVEADLPTPCLACGGATEASRLIRRALRYRRCPWCHSSVLARLPTAAELQHHYETVYQRHALQRASEERGRLFTALLERLDALGARRSSPARLLDLGCGSGSLVRLARQRGWRAVGTDLAWDACDAARRADSFPAVQADSARLSVRGGSMAAVTLVNVVDQAWDPRAIVNEAYRVLSAGGMLVVRVPNAAFHRPCVRVLTSLGPLVRWRAWDAYPTIHHFAFGALGLRWLVERAGFTVLETRNSSLAFKTTTAGRSRLVAALWRCGEALVATAAATVATLSRGRWLIGPSIELYARKERS